MVRIFAKLEKTYNFDFLEKTVNYKNLRFYGIRKRTNKFIPEMSMKLNLEEIFSSHTFNLSKIFLFR